MLNENQIRLSGPIESDSIVNGDGLRAVVWCQGCRFKCPGCHNPESWNECGGMVFEIEEVKEKLRRLNGQTGLTFCGGEPTLQSRACKQLADWAREEMGWNIWSFTGNLYENIKAENSDAWEFVKSLDVLIDGPFILAQRDISIKFRGSRNQRLLHLKDGEITKIE